MFARLIQLKFPMRMMILFVLAMAIMGRSNVKNIRPEAITPNFQSTLTVMTFNIRHGCGLESWGEDSNAFFKSCTKNNDTLIAAIQSVNPDVIGLQEVSNGQAELIARALNMNYVYGTHNSFGYGSWWGNALLTKFKILESEKIVLGGSSGINRSMISAIGLVNYKPVAFASIHTDHRLQDDRSVKKYCNF